MSTRENEWESMSDLDRAFQMRDWDTVRYLQDRSSYRWIYWDEWTGDPKWVKRARVQAEGRIAADNLARVISAPFGAILHQLERMAVAVRRHSQM